jgi:hypothetical protein
MKRGFFICERALIFLSGIQVAIDRLSTTTILNVNVSRIFYFLSNRYLNRDKFISLIDKPLDKLYSHHIFIDTINKLSLKSNDAIRSINATNAGGNSKFSEALSIQYFISMFDASDIFLEMEVEYWIDYKMVDFICSIKNQRIGVSVTRAMKYPNPDEFTFEDGLLLLRKKLYGLIVARNGVTKDQRFYKSVLHIWCQTFSIANILYEVFKSLDINDFQLKVKTNIILLLTVSSDLHIYKNHHN